MKKRKASDRGNVSQSDSKLLRFVDESFLLDQRLHLTASLCLAAQDQERIDTEVVQGVGLTILSYLQKRNLTEHFFFRRAIQFHLDEASQRAELLRLKLTYQR